MRPKSEAGRAEAEGGGGFSSGSLAERRLKGIYRADLAWSLGKVNAN